MGKKLRRVEDLEDIPDTVFGQFPGQKERGNLIGNIYEMSSDSCESQGGEMTETEEANKKEELERRELIISHEVKIRNTRSWGKKWETVTEL